MASASFFDFIFDKLLTFSAKMKGESPHFFGTSYLMNGNSDPVSEQLYSPELFNGLMSDAVFDYITNTESQRKQSLGIFGNNSFSCRNFGRPISYPMSNKNKDIYLRFGNPPEQQIPSKSMLIHLMSSVLLNQFPEMSRNFKPDLHLKTFMPSVDNSTAAVNKPEPNRNAEVAVKCVVTNTSSLNKEYANRKTKEMLKRSKKRRRRQKKNQVLNYGNQPTISDDKVNNSIISSVSNCVRLISDCEDFECSVSLNHPTKTPILSSFVLTVEAPSSDESDWGSHDQCDSNTSCDGTSCCSREPTATSHVKTDCSCPLKCLKKASNFLASFLVPVASASDDESDWDSCETEVYDGTPEFEFTGLFVTDISCPQMYPQCFDRTTSDEDDEAAELKLNLKKVNDKWNEFTRDTEVKQKLNSKVSFAAEESLVEVFPADNCERKGEWENYALERLRFKRKIDELEKVISPCLNPEHRSKVFKKLNECSL